VQVRLFARPSRAAIGDGTGGAGGSLAPSRPSRQTHACAKQGSGMQSRQPVAGGAACTEAALPPGGGASLPARPHAERDGAGQAACLALAALCAGSACARAELCDAGVRARGPGLARHSAMCSARAPVRWQAMCAAHAFIVVPLFHGHAKEASQIWHRTSDQDQDSCDVTHAA